MSSYVGEQKEYFPHGKIDGQIKPEAKNRFVSDCIESEYSIKMDGFYVWIFTAFESLVKKFTA